MKENRSLLEIRNQLSGQLLKAQELRPPRGLATGLQQLDEFLGQGLPLGHLTLFRGEVGTGRASLWLQTASQVLKKGGWCCWISSHFQMRPPLQKFSPEDLARLLVVQPPPDRKKALFALQEACSSQLFDLIGVDLDFFQLTRSDAVRLQRWARKSQVALVLVSRTQSWPAEALSLILDFNSPLLKVERAPHRPVPYFLKRPHHENPVFETHPPSPERISS